MEKNQKTASTAAAAKAKAKVVRVQVQDGEPASERRREKAPALAGRPERVSKENWMKRLTKKQQLGVICAIAGVLVVALIIVLVAVCGKKSTTREVDDATTEAAQDVDYDQKVTSESGGAFKAEYKLGSEQDFVVRFANLKCEDGCSNVSEVKLGKKLLKLGEDYEVRKGSIIVTLKKDLMESLKVGRHELIVAVTEDDETMLYGVKFTIKTGPTCSEGETLKEGECVKKSEDDSKEDEEDDKDKEDEKRAEDEDQDQSQSEAESDTSNKSQAQIECESKAGPVGFYAVHWVSDSEIVEANMSGTISMHRVNGVCRPYVAQSAASLTGQDFGETGRPIAEVTDATVLGNMEQDIIVWHYGDGTAETVLVDDARSVWNY